MNKKDLVNEIHARAGGTKAAIEGVLDALGNVAQHHLTQPGAELTLPGIGKLKARAQAARTARNPQTGEEVTVPARTAVKLTVAKELKDAVA